MESLPDKIERIKKGDCIKVWNFSIYRYDNNSLWIEKDDGEGSQFTNDIVYEAIKTMYNKYF